MQWYFPSWAIMKPQSTNRTPLCKLYKPSHVTDFVFFRKMTSGDVGGNTYTNRFLILFEPQPSLLSHNEWLHPLQLCFPLKSNKACPWEMVPTSWWHAACPLTTFSRSAPTFFFELLYPCGCTHPLSSHRCATTFLPDQFLAQMSTDKAEEKRARGRNMAAITNRKTSGEGGSVSWLLLRGNGNTGGSTWVRGAGPRAFAARAENKLAVKSEDSASLCSRAKTEEPK